MTAIASSVMTRDADSAIWAIQSPPAGHCGLDGMRIEHRVVSAPKATA